jgi:hypothetical protein
VDKKLRNSTIVWCLVLLGMEISVYPQQLSRYCNDRFDALANWSRVTPLTRQTAIYLFLFSNKK